jgi:peptidoglycan/xylan/chitin deacetylase (PgdA/CDA1 family)
VAFKKHNVPVTGFVNEKRIESLGAISGRKILEGWVAQGLDLGNHTYSHADVNRLSVLQIEEEIRRGETTTVHLMNEAHRKPEFFRFPMNHTGDTKEKHDEIAAFLAHRGYELATCTIDNSDYVFNNAYVRMLENKDNEAAERLRHDYLAYTGSEIDYYSSLNKRVLGYEPPQVMLLHDNRLNADMIDSLLTLFKESKYTFVSLGIAQSDKAYRIPDTFISPYGPMWGYRWAKERNVHVEGKLEPEPPKWVFDYLGRANKRGSPSFTAP